MPQFHCTLGKLTIDDHTVSVEGAVDNWTIRKDTISGISRNWRFFNSDIIFNTPQGAFMARAVKNKHWQTIKDLAMSH